MFWWIQCSFKTSLTAHAGIDFLKLCLSGITHIHRLKEEILQNAGVYGAGCSDPVLEARVQRYTYIKNNEYMWFHFPILRSYRFNQHTTAIERLHNATSVYMKQLDALSTASASLAHEFKSYFQMQLVFCTSFCVMTSLTLLYSECAERRIWWISEVNICSRHHIRYVCSQTGNSPKLLNAWKAFIGR